MERRIALAAMLAGLMLGASGVQAQPLTTNTYDAGSTSDDIRISCKELSLFSTSNSEVILSAKCNKENSPDASSAVSVVSTTINMLTYASCLPSGRGGSRVKWGSASANATLVDPIILLTSTGNSYAFGARCARDDGTLYSVEWSGMDIGETTDGLENDAGSLAKR